jgi:hypothetical protein
MALTPDARRDRKIVNQFLANDGVAQSGFLGQLDNDIRANRAQRRTAQKVNRAIGAGAFEGNSPFRNSPMVNPSGAGGRQILQQGMGQIPPVGGPQQLALPSASRGLPATIGGNTGSLVPTGNLPVPAGPPGGAGAMGPAGALGPSTPTPGAPTNVIPGSGTPRPTGPIAGTTRAAASQADEFVRIAGEAAVQGSDDAARAASRQAGVNAAKAGPAGLRQSATNLGVNVTRGGLMKGAGAAGAGYMVSQFFDGLNVGGEQSVLDRGGSGALLGAGLGGGAAIALGLGAGPAGWAALGGAALIGGARALWGGSDTKLETQQKAVTETRDTISELAGMYGLEGDAVDDIMMQFDASTQLYIQNKDVQGLKDFMGGITTNLPALMLQAKEQQKTANQEQQRYEAMMQTQAQFAPIFEQTLNRAAQSNQMATAQANNTANYLDQRQPQLAALYRSTAAQSEAAAANLQAAYAKQMAEAPITTGTSDELQRQLAREELMNQQIAQSAQYAGF